MKPLSNRKRLFILSDGKNPHTLKWVRGLASEGYSIFLYSLSPFDPALYAAFPNVQMEHAHFDEKLKKSGDGALMKIQYLKVLLRVRELVRKFNPDIVHAHFASSYGLIGALSGFHPFYISVWGADVYDFPKKSFLHKCILMFNLMKADRLFSTSFVMAEETSQYTKKKIDIIPFGVDVKRFSPQTMKHPMIPENHLVIGTVKSLEDKYGITYLLEAFAILKKRRPETPMKLLIVGRGTKEAKYKELAASLGIASDTIFTGFIPVEQVADYQNMIDIPVFPSILDSESFGVAVVEASSCAKPVIVSAKGGLKEVVEDGVSGIIIEAKDSSLIADAIIKLIDNPELRKNYGTHGRERVMKLYDWQLNLKTMINAYQD